MRNNPYSGKFIVFEGLDGSGQSTQAKLLFDYFREIGKKAYLTSEPSQSLIGGLGRSQLQGHWKSNAECLQLLFTADRSFHLEKEIIPLLKKGIAVICTRYILSTLAYGNIDIKDGKWLKIINDRFIWPDITFLLKVSAKICIQRIKKERWHEELFEKEEKLEKVFKNYFRFSKDFKNIHIINGEKPVKEVSGIIKKYV